MREFRSFVYDDANGKEIGPGYTLIGNPTIGIGRCLSKKRGITLTEGSFLLNNDIDKCVDDCQKAFAWFTLLTPVRQMVIADMAFNEGIAGVGEFVMMIEAIVEKDFVTAANQMLKSGWAREVGARAVELAGMMKAGIIP